MLNCQNWKSFLELAYPQNPQGQRFCCWPLSDSSILTKNEGWESLGREFGSVNEDRLVTEMTLHSCCLILFFLRNEALPVQKVKQDKFIHRRFASAVWISSVEGVTPVNKFKFKFKRLLEITVL